MLDLIIVVSIAVIVGLVSHIPIKSSRPRITSVKEWKQNRLNEHERMIYEWLTSKGYYVSCHIREQNKVIPLALEPFRIALFEKNNNQLLNQFRLIYFSLKGWKSVFFSKEVTEDELKGLISEIEALHGNVSNHLKHVQ
ncbi:hypothetical protein [Salipaludibacillus daqingensis]|uniref:hypothetical protein n=1 Tax=Salipaludibacillus daqingensis TaxID=3041001 RepID=UPI002475B595|nr:hypothetical protein [Salipaludibacillus daqingensis]